MRLIEWRYLTLVRYAPDAPMGKATALINRRTASIEVKPGESVVLVLLIAKAISVSLVDMHFQPSYEVLLDKSIRRYADGHLGAIQIQRNGLLDQWRRQSTNKERYCWEVDNSRQSYILSWWELSSQQINESGFYSAACGGGACTAGSCGGGACSSAGGCGGGACSGGCGGGGGSGGGCSS